MPHLMSVEALERRSYFATTLPTGFTDKTLAVGLNQPTSLVELPDGRLLVTQKSGALRVIKSGGALGTPAMTLSVNSAGERGLLAVEADPNFSTNHYIYVHYFRATKANAIVSRFTMTGDTVVAGSELVLLQIDPQKGGASHAGGGIHFGKDGKLYIAVGENEIPEESQSLATMHGKLLRINSNGSIPTDNPYYGTLAGPLRSIYAIGLRNPFTSAVDKVSGTIYINDVGAKAFEEINQARKGANFGWPNTEGYTSDPAYDSPVYAYAPPAAGVSTSIGGGAFYTGVTQQFPANYAGKYFVGDYAQQIIQTFDPATRTASPFASGIGKVIDVDAARDGTLVVLTYDGVVHGIKFSTGPVDPPVDPPPTGTASVSGYVINDKNANGTWDSGELGIAGRTVWLDLDDDGVLDSTEPTRTTASNGKFTFDGLAAGNYKIREIVPAGSKQTSPANGFGLKTTLTAGQVKSRISFQVATV